MKNISTNKQSGAVSLFVVVFFMLLVTVVTISFLRLMLSDQQQASNNDLSQSAYDSAQAGVEDAKRALLKYKQDCNANPASCNGLATALGTDECNAALNGISGTGARGPNGKTDEIMVQQSVSGGDTTLDQAYTCVTIKLETEDYVGNLAANQSQLVPLISASAFDRVRVEWFSLEDLTSTGSSAALSLAGIGSNGQPLYNQGNWPLNRPALMRAQLMQFANNYTLAGFDSVSGSQSNGATMFLYPTSQPNIGERSFAAFDQRKNNPADDPDPKDRLTTPTPISCSTSLNAGGYACSAVMVLPQPIGAANPADRTAFLRLAPFYNASHFRVTLWNGPVSAAAVPVMFKGVQPAIDSTGRANDLFRRVMSRVDLYDTTFPYPEATIEVTGDFCKDFAVTDTTYIPGTITCTP
jgi:Tfp pilus assembly protein PilX